MKRILFFTCLLSAAVLAFCADSSGKESLPAIKINYRFNLHMPDRSNFIKWTVGSSSASDTLDVTTGASQALTTKNLMALSRNGKNKVGPESLRTLLMFPVSPFGMVSQDNLMVTSQNKQLEITFIHRGYALKITTDKNGYINVPSDCFFASGLAENINGVITFKDEYLSDGADKTSAAGVDWSKITLLPDAADENTGMQYTGKIKAEFKNGVLTLKGKLKGEAVKREQKESEPGENLSPQAPEPGENPPPQAPEPGSNDSPKAES